MAYVDVTIISPDGREYDAEVDENADDQVLLSTLVEMLNLPLRTDDGEVIEYRLSLLGATRIRRGAIIKIEKIGPPPVRNIRPR